MLKDWILPWLVSLGMMLYCGYFLYGSLKEIKEHIKEYRKEKTEKKLIWWYLEWPFIVLDALGTPGRPGLFFFLFGTILFVVFTVKIVGLLFGYSLLQ